MSHSGVLHELGLELLTRLGSPVLTSWAAEAERLSMARLQGHGDFSTWQKALAQLPPSPSESSVAALDRDRPLLGVPTTDVAATDAALRALGPWRKGPFRLFGVEIESEWRCFMKWARVLELASPFEGRRVLDVGSGNGYYLLRLLGAGAQAALGVEPGVLSVAQFLAVARALGPEPRLGLVPLGLEVLPPSSRAFDTVLSMGVLYHRREPLTHLRELGECLAPGGELILETLVVDGPEGHCLKPQGRYAQMRNVWAIPSVPTLATWLTQTGYQIERWGEVTPTTTREQSTTPWMPHPSLAQFLEPEDPSLTIEGHPAPARVLVVARLAPQGPK